MFNIRVVKDIFSEEAKKPKTLVITCGYNCRSWYCCKYRDKCRYHSRYIWHNFSVSVRSYIYRKFNTSIKFPIYIQRHSVDLSGTTKCPHGVHRNYTCWDCEYHDGCIDGLCLNEKRSQMIKEGRFEEVDYPPDMYKSHCRLFKPNEFCQDYDVETGEYL